MQQMVGGFGSAGSREPGAGSRVVLKAKTSVGTCSVSLAPRVRRPWSVDPIRLPVEAALMCSEVSPVEVHTVVVERVQQHITGLDELTRVVRRHPAVPDEYLVPGVNVDLAGTGPALEDPGVRVVDLASPVADTVEAEYRVRLGAQPTEKSQHRGGRVVHPLGALCGHPVGDEDRLARVIVAEGPGDAVFIEPRGRVAGVVRVAQLAHDKQSFGWHRQRTAAGLPADW